MKILIVSHGDLAAGMASTFRTFFGGQNVYSACVTPEGGVQDLLDSCNKYFAEWGDEQVVICSDLKAGSANQTVFPFISRPDTYVVTGMNLALILQLMLADSVDAESLQHMIDRSKEDMVLMNTIALDTADDDE